MHIHRSLHLQEIQNWTVPQSFSCTPSLILFKTRALFNVISSRIPFSPISISSHNSHIHPFLKALSTFRPAHGAFDIGVLILYSMFSIFFFVREKGWKCLQDGEWCNTFLLGFFSPVDNISVYFENDIVTKSRVICCGNALVLKMDKGQVFMKM